MLEGATREMDTLTQKQSAPEQGEGAVPKYLAQLRGLSTEGGCV